MALWWHLCQWKSKLVCRRFTNWTNSESALAPAQKQVEKGYATYIGFLTSVSLNLAENGEQEAVALLFLVTCNKTWPLSLMSETVGSISLIKHHCNCGSSVPVTSEQQTSMNFSQDQQRYNTNQQTGNKITKHVRKNSVWTYLMCLRLAHCLSVTISVALIISERNNVKINPSVYYWLMCIIVLMSQEMQILNCVFGWIYGYRWCKCVSVEVSRCTRFLKNLHSSKLCSNFFYFSAFMCLNFLPYWPYPIATFLYWLRIDP